MLLPGCSGGGAATRLSTSRIRAASGAAHEGGAQGVPLLGCIELSVTSDCDQPGARSACTRWQKGTPPVSQACGPPARVAPRYAVLCCAVHALAALTSLPWHSGWSNTFHRKGTPSGTRRVPSKMPRSQVSRSGLTCTQAGRAPRGRGQRTVGAARSGHQAASAACAACARRGRRPAQQHAHPFVAEPVALVIEAPWEGHDATVHLRQAGQQLAARAPAAGRAVTTSCCHLLIAHFAPWREGRQLAGQTALCRCTALAACCLSLAPAPGCQARAGPRLARQRSANLPAPLAPPPSLPRSRRHSRACPTPPGRPPCS